MLLFEKEERKKTFFYYLSLGRRPIPSPTALALHNTKKYFFWFVINLLSGNFSLLILCDRQLSDCLPTLFLNLNHPHKLPLSPPLQS